MKIFGKKMETQSSKVQYAGVMCHSVLRQLHSNATSPQAHEIFPTTVTSGAFCVMWQWGLPYNGFQQDHSSIFDDFFEL
jgi:hypothetical protein